MEQCNLSCTAFFRIVGRTRIRFDSVVARFEPSKGLVCKSWESQREPSCKAVLDKSLDLEKFSKRNYSWISLSSWRNEFSFLVLLSIFKIFKKLRNNFSFSFYCQWRKQTQASSFGRWCTHENHWPLWWWQWLRCMIVITTMTMAWQWQWLPDYNDSENFTGAHRPSLAGTVQGERTSCQSQRVQRSKRSSCNILREINATDFTMI